MLTIRDKQMKAFKPIAEAIFLSKIERLLCENYPDVIVYFPSTNLKVSDVPKNLLQEIIKKCIDKARQYKLTGESAIGNFVLLMFLIAPNFDEHPSIQSILKNTVTRYDSRMTLINENITEREWFEARRDYNKNAWSVKEEGGKLWV